MSGYHRGSSYYYQNSPNQSIDPFSSPQAGRRGYSNQQPQQSIDVFAVTPKRRSYGENGTISRAIGNALDPEYGYSEPSVDIFSPSTSTHVDYDDDASILAAVSSAHSSQGSSTSSQEQRSSQKSVSDLFRKTERKEKSKREVKDKYASIFNKALQHDDEDSTMQDFMSPEQIAHHRKLRKQRPKQIRMDDYVFKARRVDKGAREFGLHTTHEPKRGSKKKRDSIEQLEVEKIEFDRQKQKKTEKIIENRRNEVEHLDFSLAFATPSPVRNKPKTSKLTKFFEKDTSRNNTPLKQTAKNTAKNLHNQKSLITFNDPSIYSNDSFLEATVCSTPDKSQLAETIPLDTPSPARIQQTTPKRNGNLESYYRRQPVPLGKPNPIKRKEFSFENPDRQPLAQPKKQKVFSSRKMPEFDYPSSPITLNDDDEDLKKKVEPLKRQTLRDEEEKRKTFAAHVTEREQMMRKLVDQKFKEERENGGIETRRAELKDGQVIRNKEMRKNLMHGAACQCCRGYYDRLGMEEHEKKDYINKISRHRYVHQALPDTPPHYWDLTLGPREEEERQMTQQRNWESSIKNKKSEERTGIHRWN
ncbi:unnamed protein product [Caenorhabditis brenneri]